MKKSIYVTMIFAAVMTMLIQSGCFWEKTTTDDGAGNTSASINAGINESDVTAWTNALTIANNVWTLVSAVITSTKDMDVASLTESQVKMAATSICDACYRECGKLPTAQQVAAYVQSGTRPSAAALQRFADTGNLYE